MKLRKFNYKTLEYEDYEVPDNWEIAILEEMDTEINCAQCGKELEFGASFKSFELCNRIGSRYSVCSKCFKKEMFRLIDYEYRCGSNE